jgi:hypothetical protein
MICCKDIEALNIIQSTVMHLMASEQWIFQDSHFKDAIVMVKGLVWQLELKVQLHNLDITNHEFIINMLVLADNKDTSSQGISNFVNMWAHSWTMMALGMSWICC